MKILWRVGLALLFGAALLPLTAARVLAAPAAPSRPSFVCAAGAKPQTCAAATAIWLALDAAGMATSDALVAGMLASVANGLASPPDLGECSTDPSADVCLITEGEWDAIVAQLDEAILRDSTLAGAIGDLFGGTSSGLSALEEEWMCALWPGLVYCPTPLTTWLGLMPPATFRYAGPVVPAVTLVGTMTAKLQPNGVLGALITLPSTYPRTETRVMRWHTRSDEAGCCGQIEMYVDLAPDTGTPTTATWKIRFTDGSGSYSNIVASAVPFPGFDERVWVGGRATPTSVVANQFCMILKGHAATCLAHNYIGALMGTYASGNWQTGGDIYQYGAVVEETSLWAGSLGVTTAQVQTLADSAATYPDEFVYPWVDPEDDNPEHRASPAAPGTVAPAPTIPEAPSYSPNTTIAEPASETETQTNAIGSFFDSLANSISGGFSWLLGGLTGLLGHLGDLLAWMGNGIMGLLRWIGDLLNVVIDWLALIRTTLVELMVALVTNLQAVVVKLGTVISAVVAAIAQMSGSVVAWLQTVVQAIVSLPTTLLNGLQSLLHDLFVPDSLTALDLRECEAGFPCGWVTEAGAAMGALGSGVAGAAGGSCTPPVIGWSEFLVSFPPPSGCSAAGGTLAAVGAEGVGDLFGWRVALRGAALLAFSWFFLLRVIGMTPWGEATWDRHAPTQQTLFD